MVKNSLTFVKIFEALSGKLVAFDYHPDFGMAYILRGEFDVRLTVNDFVVKQWPHDYWQEVWSLRFLDRDRILVWSVPEGVAIVSTEGVQYLNLGAVSNLVVSENYLFITYSEEASESAESDDVEFSIAGVYSFDGKFITSVRDQLVSADLGTNEIFIEISRLCASEGNRFFFTAYKTPYIWEFNVPSGLLKPKMEIDARNVVAITAHGQKLWALMKMNSGSILLNAIEESSVNCLVSRSESIVDGKMYLNNSVYSAKGNFLSIMDNSVYLLQLE